MLVFVSNGIQNLAVVLVVSVIAYLAVVETEAEADYEIFIVSYDVESAFVIK